MTASSPAERQRRFAVGGAVALFDASRRAAVDPDAAVESERRPNDRAAVD